MALACEASIDIASQKVGGATRTVNRRLEGPDFQKRLAEVRTDMVKRATSVLTAAATEAVKTPMVRRRPHPRRCG